MNDRLPGARTHHVRRFCLAEEMVTVTLVPLGQFSTEVNPCKKYTRLRRYIRQKAGAVGKPPR